MRVKCPNHPHPLQAEIGPCSTVIKIVGRPGTESLPSTIAPPDHPHNFQYRDVLLIWKIVGQGLTVLAVDPGGVVGHCFLLSSFLSCLPLPVRRPDIDWNNVSKGR